MKRINNNYVRNSSLILISCMKIVKLDQLTVDIQKQSANLDIWSFQLCTFGIRKGNINIGEKKPLNYKNWQIKMRESMAIIIIWKISEFIVGTLFSTFQWLWKTQCLLTQISMSRFKSYPKWGIKRFIVWRRVIFWQRVTCDWVFSLMCKF